MLGFIQAWMHSFKHSHHADIHYHTTSIICPNVGADIDIDGNEDDESHNRPQGGTRSVDFAI